MTWVTREILIKMGSLILMVQRHDEKEAAAAGLLTKTLTAANIEKHLADFSIEAEQASHTQIGSHFLEDKRLKQYQLRLYGKILI